MTLEVPLGSIRAAFQGVIPSPVATASADGEPHSTYLSIVWYVDEERIAGLGIEIVDLGLVAWVEYAGHAVADLDRRGHVGDPGRRQPRRVLCPTDPGRELVA